MLAGSLACAGTTIGTDALVSLPKSAEYNGTVNIRPGNGDVVDLNPPIFSWFYVSNILTATADFDQFFNFQFQVATNSNFINRIVDKPTFSNLYNTLAPFTNANGSSYALPLYWRVGYVVGTTTNFYWTNTFTVSNSATNWDRSMLADETYLAAKYSHPHVFLNATNRIGLYNFFQTNSSADWTLFQIRYAAATNAAYWTSGSAWDTNDPTVIFRAFDVGAAVAKWALSQDPDAVDHLAENYNLFVNWYKGVNYQWTDYGNGDNPMALETLALGFDWLYSILSTAQRTNAMGAIQQTARFYNRNAFWSIEENSGHWVLNCCYTNTRLMTWSNSGRTGTSHQWFDSSMAGILGSVAYGEGGDCREFYDLWVNYMIGRGNFTGGWSAINQGRGYASVQIAGFGGGLIYTGLGYMSAFPESALNRIPNYNGAADWFSCVTPPGYWNVHDNFGDGGFLGALASYWNTLEFKNLALLASSREAWRAYANQVLLGASGSEHYWYQMVSGYGVTPPPSPTNSSSAKLFSEDGWVTASTYGANTLDAFTNGVGFVFTARPRGTEGGHSINCDGGIDIWAYGAKVTDGGGYNLDPYGYLPEAQDTVFVNGQGEKVNSAYANYSAEQILPWYARIAAYSNSASFTYAMGDITPAFTNTYNPQSANVIKVKRHVLFSRTGKYLVLYDELSARTNSTFSWQWHILQPGVANITSSGFNYGCTNFAGQTVTNYVFFATSGLTVTNMTGTNVLRNPITGVWTSDANDPHRRANALWYSSSPSTSGSFLAVIAPQQPGKSAPSFSRLDDSTVAVTYDGVTETNTFGTAYAGAFTYRVALTDTPTSGTTLNVINLNISGSITHP